MNILIIGLGYVGLPLALAFARAGNEVIGIDVDAQKVELLNHGKGYLQHIDISDLPKLLNENKFKASADFSEMKKCQVAIICVPTPLDKYRNPDISYIIATGESLAPYLKKGDIVVLESTTYPGTTDKDLREILEKGSEMKAGQDFSLAFSPEREDPGNKNSKVEVIPKVVGGYTDHCRDVAIGLYSLIVKEIIPVSSCRVAEATKLLENIFRSVNIALVNELKVVYDCMGIDIWEVIDAAKTKPFGFMPFYPGPGLGGHCIPIDPFYLTWAAREYGQHTRFIELAGEINSLMPHYVVEKVTLALNQKEKSVKNSLILVIGIAYKADVNDLRESPALVLIELLEGLNAKVDYYDPHILTIPVTREFAKLSGRSSIKWEEKSIRKYDCILISTAHRCIDFLKVEEWGDCIIDTRNALGMVKTTKVTKA